MDIKKETMQLLSQIGYLACFKGDIETGQMIMEAVDMNSGGQIPAKIGVAISRIYASRYDDAVDILQNHVLPIEPDNMTAKCFLGMALSESGRQDEATALLQEVVRLGGPDDQTIASFYLNEMEE